MKKRTCCCERHKAEGMSKYRAQKEMPQKRKVILQLNGPVSIFHPMKVSN